MPDQQGSLTIEGPIHTEYWALSRILATPTNPKEHVGLEGSLNRFGYTMPMMIDERTGQLVAGNGRREELLAMKEAGKAPPLRVVERDGEWYAPVVRGVAFNSDEEAAAYVLADNRLTEAGGWDDALLAEIIQQALDQGGEEALDGTGFSSDDLEGIIARAIADASDGEAGAEGDNSKGGKKAEDAGPRVRDSEQWQARWQVAPGQLWEIPSLMLPGKVHRVMCGDSTVPDFVARLVGNEKARLCHADPPYGLSKESEGVSNDGLHGDRLDAFQLSWWRVWRPYLVDNGSAYIWGEPEDLWRLWICGGLQDDERLTLRNMIVWAKLAWGGSEKLDAIGKSSDEMRKYPPCTERCLFFMLGEQEFSRNSDNYWEGWEPIRAYMDGERAKTGWGPQDIKRITGVGMYSHWFTTSQWCIISEEHYLELQEAAQGQAFTRPYHSIKEEQRSAALSEEYRGLLDEVYGTRAWFDNTHDKMTDVWLYPRVWEQEDRYEHPTPKPIDMIERIMKSSAPPGSLVLSPFLGSGTDVMAAERTGRVCYAMELEPRWVAASLQRFADSGLEPRLVVSDD